MLFEVGSGGGCVSDAALKLLAAVNLRPVKQFQDIIGGTVIEHQDCSLLPWVGLKATRAFAP